MKKVLLAGIGVAFCLSFFFSVTFKVAETVPILPDTTIKVMAETVPIGPENIVVKA